MVNEMFDDVTMPPSLLGSCRDVELRFWRPSITQRISAAGLDAAVIHENDTVSPALASDGPEIVTCVGGTEQEIFNYLIPLQFP